MLSCWLASSPKAGPSGWSFRRERRLALAGTLAGTLAVSYEGRVPHKVAAWGDGSLRSWPSGSPAEASSCVVTPTQLDSSVSAMPSRGSGSS